jgi:hypothetical protein
MRAETVDCVMFILRAASMKLPVSATIKKVRARVTSIVLNDRCEGSENVSIENSDSGHRKIPFVGGVDSHQIGDCPDRVESDSALNVRVHNGRTKIMKAKAKKPAKKAAAKKPAAKKKKR